MNEIISLYLITFTLICQVLSQIPFFYQTIKKFGKTYY